MEQAKHTPGNWKVIESSMLPRGGDHAADLSNGLLVVPVVGHLGDQLADARLIAAAPDLLAALQWREIFEAREGEDANERFERIGEVFRRETGYLRPGKDCAITPHEVRQKVWDEWMEVGRSRVRAAIAKATGE